MKVWHYFVAQFTCTQEGQFYIEEQCTKRRIDDQGRAACAQVCSWGVTRFHGVSLSVLFIGQEYPIEGNDGTGTKDLREVSLA